MKHFQKKSASIYSIRMDTAPSPAHPATLPLSSLPPPPGPPRDNSSHATDGPSAFLCVCVCVSVLDPPVPAAIHFQPLINDIQFQHTSLIQPLIPFYTYAPPPSPPPPPLPPPPPPPSPSAYVCYRSHSSYFLENELQLSTLELIGVRPSILFSRGPSPVTGGASAISGRIGQLPARTHRPLAPVEHTTVELIIPLNRFHKKILTCREVGGGRGWGRGWRKG